MEKIAWRTEEYRRKTRIGLLLVIIMVPVIGAELGWALGDGLAPFYMSWDK